MRLFLFLGGFAVRLDLRQPVHQAFDVLHPKPAADERQGLPVQAAHAVGQQVEDLERQPVGCIGLRYVVALILDVWL
jgi:hypothetical protein